VLCEVKLAADYIVSLLCEVKLAVDHVVSVLCEVKLAVDHVVSVLYVVKLAMDCVVSLLCVVKLDVDCVVSVLYVVKPVVEPSRPASVAADHRQYSIQALMLLAEVTVTLLDVVYRSEEKERVIPLLSNILYNVFPYLKNHRSQSIAYFLTFIETVMIVRKFSIVSSFLIFIFTVLLSSIINSWYV